jgi:hypothetical protein
LAGDQLTHFLLVLEPALECAHGYSAEDRNPDNDHEKDKQ